MKNIDLSKITTYQAGAIQAYINRKFQKVSDDALQPFGITKMQWMIIGFVMDAGPNGTRLSDLAGRLGTTLGYLTNSVNLLESRGMLSRIDNYKDTRSKMIVVNSSYINTCQQIEDTLRKSLRRIIYDKIDPDEFKVYLKVMQKLTTINVDEK